MTDRRRWTPRRERAAFALALAGLLTAFFGESLFGGKVLSPADVLKASASFGSPGYEPANRLLIDPVLQFQPWLEFNRSMLRRGRLPLWNGHAGCGAPHLANGQSAVFDPFHLIAYLGRLPDAYAWMAAARLWVAGMGMFLLARRWKLGPWGRWFAGLAFPFCGFLVVWLLYPVTSSAIWTPWLLWATDRLFDRRDARRVGLLAAIVGLILLGGHVQTSAHVLLLGAVYAGWRGWASPRRRRAAFGWSAGVALGVAIGSIAVVPLGAYLARSPVWSDREAANPEPWQLRRPRLLDAACTALPYAFGSQRRGHPNLAKALGVHNLNESAGGFAGLATLIWLAPLALAGSARRRQPRVMFLAGLAAFAAMGAFRLPPVDNLLRALPVLGVTDNRRLTLWLAFALVLLGGVGLDRLAALRLDAGRGWDRWVKVWVLGAVALLIGAGLVGLAEPKLRARAHAHYARTVEQGLVLDASLAGDRAERQVRQVTRFVPRYALVVAAHLLALAGLAQGLRSGRLAVPTVRGGVFALTMLDLLGFGFGLNPAIDRADDRPDSPVIAALRREPGPNGRVLAIGAELPPNTLMRFGLADLRNYDSIETTRSLFWFEPLYERANDRGSTEARTSRRSITWQGVLRARERLREAGVAAVVAATPPPRGAFERVDRVGDVWIARPPASPIVTTASGRAPLRSRRDNGLVDVEVVTDRPDSVLVMETYDPGWRAQVDGRATTVEPHQGAFLAVAVGPGRHVVTLRYEPAEVRLALAISLVALAIAASLIARPAGGADSPKNGAFGLERPRCSRYNRGRDLHRTSQPVSH